MKYMKFVIINTGKEKNMHTVHGVYQSTLYRDGKSGYTIFSFRVKEQDIHTSSFGTITCKGVIPLYAKSMPLCVSGEYREDKSGEYFEVQTCNEEVSETKELVAYIQGFDFPGIGKSKAEKIATSFVPFFEALKEEDSPEKLSNLLKIEYEKAEEMIIALLSGVFQKELLHIILPCGGNSSDVAYLYTTYGRKAKEILLSNPYILCQEEQMSFYLADNIAKKNGVSYLSQNRRKALLIEALHRNEQSGNTFCLFSQLLSHIKEIQKHCAYEKNVPEMLFFPMLETIPEVTLIKEDKYRIYLTRTYKAECNIVRQINRLEKTKTEFPFKDEYIDSFGKHSSMIILDEQRNAFQILKNSGVKMLIGGPGRGKTTLICGFIEIFEEMFPEKSIALCAPTGRAAQRMSEVTGKYASTIHKLIDFRPYGKEFVTKNANDPIIADLIIVDEFSMVDTFLFSLLLSAVKNGSLLLLVGDENQLQSVGCGSILRDLIGSGQIPVYKLTSIFRQSGDSSIIGNSDKILSMDLSFDYKDDFKIIEEKTETIQKCILDTFFSSFSTEDLYHTQILSTTKKGQIGTRELNKHIQNILQKENILLYGKRAFYPGDKIIMTRNNYQAVGESSCGYFNGDMGYVESVGEDGLTVVLGSGNHFDRFCLQDECLNDIELAYAITVHKSQGSEYHRVVLVAPKVPKSLLNNYLVYTAVTRARENVTIISEDMAFYEAVLNKEEIVRSTGLKYKLKNRNIVPMFEKKTEEYKIEANNIFRRDEGNERERITGT